MADQPSFDGHQVWDHQSPATPPPYPEHGHDDDYPGVQDEDLPLYREYPSPHRNPSYTPAFPNHASVAPGVTFAESPSRQHWRHKNGRSSQYRSSSSAYKRSSGSYRHSPQIDTSNREDGGFRSRSPRRGHHHYDNRPRRSSKANTVDASNREEWGFDRGRSPRRPRRDTYENRPRKSSKANTVGFLEGLLCGMGTSRKRKQSRSPSPSGHRTTSHGHHSGRGRGNTKYDDSRDQGHLSHPRHQHRDDSPPRRPSHYDSHHGTHAPEKSRRHRGRTSERQRPSRQYGDEYYGDAARASSGRDFGAMMDLETAMRRANLGDPPSDNDSLNSV